jgi:hypothetical protein
MSFLPDEAEAQTRRGPAPQTAGPPPEDGLSEDQRERRDELNY